MSKNQALAFVLRNGKQVHIHLHVNHINYQGLACKGSFITQYSQQTAGKVAKEMGLTTVCEA